MSEISFVLPTKNRIEWIAEAISSILSQSIMDIELIIVNDGSNDGTKEFLDEWASKDSRVRIVHNEKSMGVGYCRNLGTGMAKSPIVAQMDDDDVNVMDRAELTLKWFVENKDSELVNFPYVQCGYFNEILKNFDGEPFNSEEFKKSGNANYFSNPTVAYKKDSFSKMEGYGNETDQMTDDYIFITRWIESGKKIDFCPGNYVVLHRVLPDSVMSKKRGWNPKWASKN